MEQRQPTATGPTASDQTSWRMRGTERWSLGIALLLVLAFGVNLELRTSLRRRPMTDLGVFACAAWAARTGENIYNVTDWHGWHYQYPPALAILFAPLAHPLPEKLPELASGETRTAANTPWGYSYRGERRFYGLHHDNARFFWIVAAWYTLSVGLICLASHALACTLEGTRLRTAPPVDARRRRRWWVLRTIPLLICAGSLGTDLSRGQVDILMLGAIALAVYLAGRSWSYASGMLLAFPAAVKLFPPFVLLYPVCRRRWRMAAGVALGLALFLFVLPAATLGVKRTTELYGAWFDVLAKPALGQGTDTSRQTELTAMTATDNQSLLAFIHNWQYRQLPRKERPPQPATAARWTVYGISGLLLAGVFWVAAFAAKDRPQDLVILSGMLVGLAFVTSPIVHNYYYLLMLPLVAGLLDSRLNRGQGGGLFSWSWWPLLLFGIVDLLARLPGIGASLRDVGLPLLSLLCLLATGAYETSKQAGMRASAE